MRSMYMTHSQGQKVKGQGHKVMRRSSTKHPIYPINVTRYCMEICLSYRKSRSPERMARSDFSPEVPK